MSRFAAVPTAALDDERLEALHIRVLTALCSYADKDGWCRVGQDEVAGRARTVPARVSQCIGDLVKWGWVRRQRIGKKAVNVYQVLMDCAFDASIQMPDEQERLAPTANHVTCQPGKSNLLPEQITLAPTANPIGTPFSNTVLNTVEAPQAAPAPIPAEQPKRAAQPKSAARGSRIPSNWTPTPKDYAFASSEGLDREEINREADKFRDYWTATTGRSASKLDWEGTWRNWIRRVSDDRRKRAAGRTAYQRGGAEQTLSAFDRVAASLAGNAPRPADPVQSDAFTIEGQHWSAEARTGTDG